MADEPTCGRGLADHAAVPAAMARLTESLAGNLETHLAALDLSDERSAAEHRAYVSLVAQFRTAAAQLGAAAAEMAGYRDLPMGRHDPEAMSRPEVREAFGAYVGDEESLLTLLEASLERDRSMLDQLVDQSSS